MDRKPSESFAKQGRKLPGEVTKELKPKHSEKVLKLCSLDDRGRLILSEGQDQELWVHDLSCSMFYVLYIVLIIC